MGELGKVTDALGIDTFIFHAYNIIRSVAYCEEVNMADILFAEVSWPDIEKVPVYDDCDLSQLTRFMYAIIFDLEKDKSGDKVDPNDLMAAILYLPQNYQDMLYEGIEPEEVLVPLETLGTNRKVIDVESYETLDRLKKFIDEL